MSIKEEYFSLLDIIKLEEARQAGEEKQEEDSNKQPDIAPEDNAIEMSDGFEGKMHDLEAEGFIF